MKQCNCGGCVNARIDSQNYYPCFQDIRPPSPHRRIILEDVNFKPIRNDSRSECFGSLVFIMILISIILYSSESRIKDAKCEGRYGIAEHKMLQRDDGIAEHLMCLTNLNSWEKY